MKNKRFERLIVLRRSLKGVNNNRKYWRCLCDCGNITIVQGCKW
jgi:hypothetical protein